MEKVLSQNKQERSSENREWSPETQKIITSFRVFVGELMPFIDSDFIESADPKELLVLVEQYINGSVVVSKKEKHPDVQYETIRGDFIDMMRRYGFDKKTYENLGVNDIETNPSVRNDYIQFLLFKMPSELYNDWNQWIRSGKRTYKDLEEAVLYRSNHTPLVLGFHTDKERLSGSIIPQKSSDIFIDSQTGEERTDSSAKSWFVTDHTKLYSDKNPQAVYLVEGSVYLDDEGIGRNYDPQRTAHYSSSALPILFSIPINDETRQVFGFGLESYH